MGFEELLLLLVVHIMELVLGLTGDGEGLYELAKRAAFRGGVRVLPDPGFQHQSRTLACKRAEEDSGDRRNFPERAPGSRSFGPCAF